MSPGHEFEREVLAMTWPLPQGMSAANFLADYWQKKPLLIKAAFPGFESPLTPGEVAGMACEDGIESRLLLELDGSSPWQLRHGPFEAALFRNLPTSHWSLLVQEVQKYVPQLAHLLESFRFIPNWRVDDIMVSYAPQHGSVGAHVDQYDVFLLQGLGRKCWEISSAEVCEGDLIAHDDLRLIAHFEPQQRWELEPGDMLYLPPGIIHHGTALDDNLTYSIGFRAPTVQELSSSFVDYLARELLPNTHYHDPDLCMQEHPGEISRAALQRVREIIERIPVNDDNIARWFGQLVTESKNGDDAEARSRPLSIATFTQRFRSGERLRRCEMSRFAFIDHATSVLLFVAGTVIELDTALSDAVHLLCNQRLHATDDWAVLLTDEDNCALLCRLINAGHLVFENDED